jgi:hypothetical protein
VLKEDDGDEEAVVPWMTESEDELDLPRPNGIGRSGSGRGGSGLLLLNALLTASERATQELEDEEELVGELDPSCERRSVGG